MERGFVLLLRTAQERLDRLDAKFVELLHRGTLSVELYRPHPVDEQSPHDRDELYVVQAGTGTFVVDGERHPIQPGDLLFAAAGVAHRFEEFSEDLTVWVLFYGPVGGEAGDV